ncbi:MAG: RpiB/LacA/LacB family sugar-phosphate isomerase, partial [Akkermansiaceae bacterium]|nr:RpiB/LacA/LacB family sugar-phosphate isomerase [Akkermansiaceae bacterium]
MNNGTLRIALGADHGGVTVKKAIIEALEEEGEKVVDFGASGGETVDYPDYAQKVARSVASGNCDFGVLICKSGIGMSIAANRVRGVRAARLCTTEDAVVTRGHNDSNVACLGSNGLTP